MELSVDLARTVDRFRVVTFPSSSKVGQASCLPRDPLENELGKETGWKPVLRWKPVFRIACLLLFCGGRLAHAQGSPTAAQNANPTVSFAKDVAPIFSKKCFKCHSAEKPKGSFQLHTFDLLLKAGDSKSAPIVPGEPAKSELYRRLMATDEEDRMPQKDDPLPASQIALIERWIKEGARFDGPDPKAPIVSLIPREPYPDPPPKYRFPIQITALAFSPDASELAVAGYHEITVWDPAAGKLLRRIKNVAERTYALAFSPNGLRLAAAGGAPGQTGEAALYDPTQGHLVKNLGTTTDVMLALCFSPDGARLAVGGADNAIRIYEVATGKETLVIQQHADWVMALAFSGDGSHLASASRDRSARVYDSRTGELQTTFNEHGGPVLAVAFASDGKQVFSAGKEKKILVWNVGDARKAGEMSGFDGDVNKLLADGRNLFSCSTDKMVRQHDATDRKLVQTYSGHKDWVYSLAYHAQTKRLASGSHDGEVRVWTTEDAKVLASFTAAPGYLTAEAQRKP
ncbi:MAG: hypothetical protein HYY23_01905 [Verrucomicrobia bacterium]|nr:hypothetical protein [Verrucomicrobiota bacterium]